METKTVKYINVNGKLMDLSHPQVMGILNVTPDSFYAGSRQQTEKDIINRTSQIIEEGASIIDIGAYSSRPNAEHISPEEEMRRLRTGLENHQSLSSRLCGVRGHFPCGCSPDVCRGVRSGNHQ